MQRIFYSNFCINFTIELGLQGFFSIYFLFCTCEEHQLNYNLTYSKTESNLIAFLNLFVKFKIQLFNLYFKQEIKCYLYIIPKIQLFQIVPDLWYNLYIYINCQKLTTIFIETSIYFERTVQKAIRTTIAYRYLSSFFFPTSGEILFTMITLYKKAVKENFLKSHIL